MLKQAILLTGEREFSGLKKYLLRFNPQLDVRFAGTMKELEQECRNTGYQARLIGFTTGVIVPQSLLDQLELTPYNFHPGPPDCPGRYPESWGVYHEARWFGATMHQMVKLVDAGPIIEVERFEVPAGVDRFDMAKLCYACVTQLFVRMASQLAIWSSDLPIRPELQWSGRKWTLADFEELRDNPPADDPVETARRFRAFGAPQVQARSTG
jgi:hypothetical protein